MIHVKILCNKTRLRYSVRRAVEAAQASLLTEHPHLQLDITEISAMDEIHKYTAVMVAPVLVINEKVVYDAWIPRKEQVIDWLRQALAEQSNPVG